MKEITFLALSDIHGKEDIAKFFIEWVKKQKHKFDFIIAAGDIGNPQKPGSFENIMSALASLGKPVYYVKGNWDVNTKCVSGARDLEESSPLTFGDIVIVGHGRSVKPLELPDAPVRVLVTHYPPFSIMDRGKKLDGPHQTLHSGLPEINYLIELYKPRVHIFGHSHSFGGVDLLVNGTLFINVARLDRTSRDGSYIGNYALITIREDGKVSVKWFFLNGIWKRCGNCGRVVHLPKEWTICRKCANRGELRYVRIEDKFSRIKLSVFDLKCKRTLLRKILKIPIKSIKDKTALEDFLDLIILREVSDELRRKHKYVISLPKDRVINFYGKRQNGLIIPFSEYLFSRRREILGDRLLALMEVFSLDKRVHVLWGVDELLLGTGKVLVISGEYVLFNARLIECNSSLTSILLAQGFRPLVYTLEVTTSYRSVSRAHATSDAITGIARLSSIENSSTNDVASEIIRALTASTPVNCNSSQNANVDANDPSKLPPVI